MNRDVIRMSLPANPDYILAVKLAVSAVAERMGFNIDDIQDIKEISAEGCSMLFSCGPELLDISMVIQKDVLDMDIRAARCKESIKKPSGNSSQKLESKINEYYLETLADECVFTRRGETVTGVHFRRRCRPNN